MLKVAVIGGGSTYTPELFQGFLSRQEDFPLDELWLMDIDAERLKIVGEFVKRLAEAKGARFKVRLTTNQSTAIKNAAYVITQLRVGKMQARREDEYLGNRHGLIGQETTGIGGMAKALRTIPVILNIAEDIRKLSPQALLINFTNPSGLITEALTRYAPQVNSVGVCNATLTIKMEILHQLKAHLGYEIPPNKAHIKVLGLNHLTWFYGFQVNDVDYWPLIMRMIVKEFRNSADPDFDPETLNVLGMLPNTYLRYFYYTNRMLAKQKQWPPSRAEAVFEIEKELLNSYQNNNQLEIPEVLMSRGGAYYSTVATQLIDAHHNNLEEIHIVNVRHNGAVVGWPQDWVLELPCQVSSSGIIPLPADPLPSSCSSLIGRVKAYEIMTVEAAVHKSRSAAYEALMIHPLGPPADEISNVLDDLFLTNRDYIKDYV